MYEMNLHRTNYTRTRVCPHTHAHTLSPQNPAKSARALWMALTSFSFPEPPPGCTSEDAPIAGNIPSPNCRRPRTRLELAPDYAGASRPLPNTAACPRGTNPRTQGARRRWAMPLDLSRAPAATKEPSANKCRERKTWFLWTKKKKWSTFPRMAPLYGSCFKEEHLLVPRETCPCLQHLEAGNAGGRGQTGT